VSTRRRGFGSAAAAIFVAALATGAPAAQMGESGAPPEQNLPRSWQRNFDYGVEMDGKSVSDAGLFMVAGKPYMLMYSPAFDPCYVLSLDAKMVRPVRRDQITPKGDEEVMLAEAAFEKAAPLPYLQDGAAGVIFYGGQKRYKISRIPSLVGPTTLDDLFAHSPIYKRNADAYEPEAGAVAALKRVLEKVQVEIWFGTWCPHCKMLVPRLVRALQGAANPNIEVVYHAVPQQFGSYEPAKAKDIRAVPTIIFLKNGKEIGRIRGGAAGGTIEDEAAKILGEKTSTVGSAS